MDRSIRVSLAALVAVAVISGLAALRPAAAAVASKCFTKPIGGAPKGQHWYYNSDRQTKRRCWYLAAKGLKVGAHKGALPRVSTRTPLVRTTRANMINPPPPPLAARPSETAHESGGVHPPGAIAATEAAQAPLPSGAVALHSRAPAPQRRAAAPRLMPVEIASPTAMAAMGGDLDMTGARGAVLQDDANADDETQPAADAVWPALLAQPVAAASLLPTTPGAMLAILFGSLVFAGIALRGIMLAVRRAA